MAATPTEMAVPGGGRGGQQQPGKPRPEPGRPWRSWLESLFRELLCTVINTVLIKLAYRAGLARSGWGIAGARVSAALTKTACIANVTFLHGASANPVSTVYGWSKRGFTNTADLPFRFLGQIVGAGLAELAVVRTTGLLFPELMAAGFGGVRVPGFWKPDPAAGPALGFAAWGGLWWEQFLFEVAWATINGMIGSNVGTFLPPLETGKAHPRSGLPVRPQDRLAWERRKGWIVGALNSMVSLSCPQGVLNPLSALGPAVALGEFLPILRLLLPAHLLAGLVTGLIARGIHRAWTGPLGYSPGACKTLPTRLWDQVVAALQPRHRRPHPSPAEIAGETDPARSDAPPGGPPAGYRAAELQGGRSAQPSAAGAKEEPEDPLPLQDTGDASPHLRRRRAL